MCHILFFQATWISPTVHIVHFSEVEACGFQSEVKTKTKNLKQTNKTQRTYILSMEERWWSTHLNFSCSQSLSHTLRNSLGEKKNDQHIMFSLVMMKAFHGPPKPSQHHTSYTNKMQNLSSGSTYNSFFSFFFILSSCISIHSFPWPFVSTHYPHNLRHKIK